MIGLPRSTYYRRSVSPLALSTNGPVVDRDDALRDAITAVRQAHPAYGYRRVTHALRRTGLLVNHKRVQRVMRTLLAPPMPRRRSWLVAEPDAVTGSWYPNLRAECTPTAADQLWVADMTYLRVGAEAAFLAVVLDAWSRKVIGYALGPVLDARLPLAALDAALDTRTPTPECIHHSGRGSQYASRRYRERLAAAGLRGSMSRAGNPYDNAHVESFMKTIKHEEIYLRAYRTMAALMSQLPLYLEQPYNGTRLHSALDYVTPDEYERVVHPTPLEVK
jgi:putative transposase